MRSAVEFSLHARFARLGEIIKRAARAEYKIHWDTLTKIVAHTEPSEYRLAKERSSKLEPLLQASTRFLSGARAQWACPENQLRAP